MRYLIAALMTLLVSASCQAQEPFDPGSVPPPIVEFPDQSLTVYTKRTSEIAPDVEITAPPSRIQGCGVENVTALISSTVGIQRVDFVVTSTLIDTKQRYYLTAPPWTVEWVMPCDFQLPGGNLNHTYKIKVIVWDTGEDHTTTVQYSITAP